MTAAATQRTPVHVMSIPVLLAISMGMGGVFLAVERPRKLVNNEKFDEAWYPGEMVGTLEFVEKGGKTLMYQTLRYESREARAEIASSSTPATQGAAHWPTLTSKRAT